MILKSVIYYLVGKLIKEKPMPPMTYEQEMGVFSQLWQNDAFRSYLNAREIYVIHNAVELLLAEKLKKADGLTGQLLEIRSLRDKAKSSYLIVTKKRDAIAKEQKKKSES